MTTATPRLRPGPTVLAMTTAMIVAVTGSGWWALASLLAALGLTLRLAPAALRPILSWRWLLLILMLILPGALWVGQPDSHLLGIPYSRSGLILGLQMACRATTIFLGVSVLSQRVSVMQMARMLERAGIRDIGFAIGVGFHALPTLQRRFVTAYAAFRLRGGFRRQRWRGLQLLIVTVISGALRYAEDVLMAAQARAFPYDN
ncbi:MAG: hypothetical protein HPY64_02230 [Anaerolineae bacterium]|nr:hypothetical protein [Anaerolineae bacterium]